MGSITLRTNGALQLKDQGSGVGSNSSVLTIGTLYRVGIRQKTGTGSNAILEAYLASGDDAFGAAFASETTGNWTTQADRFRWGATTGTVDALFDNIRLDSGSMPPSGSAPNRGKAGLAAPAPHLAHVPQRWFRRPAHGMRAMPLLTPPAGQIWKSYYYAGGQRVALRVEGDPTPANNGLFFLLGDHLGSTSITTNGTTGALVAELRYYPWGDTRYTNGTTPTTYRFTGQRQEASLGGLSGLYFYNARWYDPAIGRFLQADTIVPDPGNPQTFNRYSYVGNRPLNFTDPSGHCFGPLAEVCAELAFELIVNLIVKDVMEDGRFDTPNEIRYTVTTGAAVATGNPLGQYRDSNLGTHLNKASPDLTSWLASTMKANASGAVAQTLRDANAGSWEDKTAAYLGWTALVRPGAPWDYKVEFRKMGIDSVVLAGREFNFDVVANIHFGYVGQASGFSGEELLLGAGAAQALFGPRDLAWWKSNFDSPEDQWAIWVGMWLYDNPGMTLEDAIARYGDYLRPP